MIPWTFIIDLLTFLYRRVYTKKLHIFSTPLQVNYIPSMSYVTDVLRDQRPLNTIESGNIYFNLKKSDLQKALTLGFSKVCLSNEIRKFMGKGMKVITKHLGLFSSILQENNLHVPTPLDLEITDSSIAPFSDKLMLFHVGTLFSMALRYYNYAAVTSMRADLIVHFETAISRDFKITYDNKSMAGTPPISDDRITVKD